VSEAYTADFDDDAGRSSAAGRPGAAAASVSESGAYTEDWHASSDAAGGGGSGLASEVLSEARVGGGSSQSASVAEEVGSVSAAAAEVGGAAVSGGGGARGGGYSDTFEGDSVAEASWSAAAASAAGASAAHHVCLSPDAQAALPELLVAQPPLRIPALVPHSLVDQRRRPVPCSDRAWALTSEVSWNRFVQIFACLDLKAVTTEKARLSGLSGQDEFQ
jgi:hypothetical protein